MRSTPELDQKLRERFVQALERCAAGNADLFGRKLGHLNGGYVRQIAKGDKQVREAVIERVHAIDGMAGWFSDLLPPLVAADLGHRPAAVDPFGPQPSLAAQEIARSFDAIEDQVAKRRLYALLLDEIRRASAPSRPPDAAPKTAPVPTQAAARGRSRGGP